MNLSTNDEKLIAQKWYDCAVHAGLDEPECIFRFMSAWICFNFLYNHNEAQPRIAERRMINKYCIKNMQTLKAANIFNKCADELAVLLYLPVFDGRDKPDERYIHLYRDPYESIEEHMYEIQDYRIATNENLGEEKRIMALIKIIYQVRCNLFHGSKLPNDSRDYALVRNSTKVLETFLHSLLNAHD